MGKIRIRSRYRGRIPQTIAESAAGVDTPTIQVTGVGGNNYPNEPAGLVQIYHHSCDGLPETGTATIEEVVAGGSWTTLESANLDTVTDATAPVNGPTVIRHRWPAGMQDGVGPGGGLNCNFGRSYGEMYWSYRYRIIASGSPAGWERQGTTTKLTGYMSYGLTNRNNQFFMWHNPNTFAVDSEPGPWSIKTDFTAEYGGPDISQNVTSTKLEVVGWNQMELYVKLNTMNGSTPNADGIHRAWMNGTLVIERTNLVIVGGGTSFTTNGFYKLHYHPIWGGDNGQVKTRDDFVYLCDLYASGIEQ